MGSEELDEMKIDDFLNLLKTRRSMRRFRRDSIPDEYIEKMIEAARWAPSGANAQPWEFIIVKDPETRERIAQLLLRVHQEEHYCVEQTRIEELRHNEFLSMPKELYGFKDAPVLIVVCGDRRTLQASSLPSRFIGTEGGGGDATYLKNMANPVMLMHLAAVSCGLGAQWLSVEDPFEKPVKEILNVPDELEIHTIVPIGYPAYEPPAPYRRKLEEVVHYEKYDQSRARSEQDVLDFLGYLRKMSKAAYGKATDLKK
jgi:nitroreductase